MTTTQPQGQTKVADIFYNDKILNIKFRKGKSIELDEAKEVYHACDKIAGNEIHANLIDSREIQFMTDESRKYFAAQDKSSVVAIALLATNRIQITLANFYLKFSKPKIPTKLFNSEPEARKWLSEKIAG